MLIALPLAARLVRSLRKLTRPLRLRSARAQLLELEDHVLRDMGLTRFDVDAMRRMW